MTINIMMNDSTSTVLTWDELEPNKAYVDSDGELVFTVRGHDCVRMVYLSDYKHIDAFICRSEVLENLTFVEVIATITVDNK